MTDAANADSSSRANRVITIVAVVIGLAFTGLWTFISIPQLMDFIGDRDVTPPVIGAIAVLVGPALFWSFIGLGIGMSALGWAAGLTVTGIFISLTGGSLLSASDGHGFSYWLFITLLVACNVGAFCVIPYVLVRCTVRRPR
ncbi:hypothetical protein [Streptomyces sp. SPB074]|uniref:hypothetical protein n=1 Tax=Streptomyces sp. (strain SPB074) TaxID=465543 RepID=UPI00017F164F|nr:hypothetical protein [Streptomyces sp. SPB074]EDY46155.1 hypothetical protein SSBG_04178 [Streptomyces sp. SPB074]